MSEASDSKAFLISEEFTENIIVHICYHLISKRLILKSCCWVVDNENALWWSPPSESFWFLPSTANDLQVNLTQRSLVASEGDEVKLECNIITGAFTPSLFYAVSWLYSSDDPSNFKALVELDHTGLLKYPQVPGLEGLQGRVRLSRLTQGSFRLHIQRSHEQDGGMYKCLINQYHLDTEGKWLQKASESAGPVKLSVKLPGRTSSLKSPSSDLHYCPK